MNKTLLIARREFLSRVQKKTFLLTTILVPLIIMLFYAMMIYFSVKGENNVKVAILDKANVFNGAVKSDKDIVFEFVQTDTATLRKDVEAGKYNGFVYVPENYATSQDQQLIYRSGKALGLMTKGKIEGTLNKALEERRLMSLNISQSTLDSIQKKTDISFTTLSGTDESAKAGISYGVGFISGFLIYIILFIYGTMVMRGVMEEKVNRIAEVIVSSVKPFQLMMGKIIGIGSVGLLQFIIWIVLVGGLQFLLPIFFPGLAEQMHSQPVQPASMQAAEAIKHASQDSGFMAGLAQINFTLIIGCFIFYFLGGYLLYSSLFAAVGSSVNEDPQDAQSLMLPITMPIIFSIVIMTKAVNDPTSGLAVFGSIFPFTSPVVMMARLAHGIPEGVTWAQLLISMALLIVTFLGTTWLAGKIYRTGILMYGKKPTWKELLKWAFR